MSEELFEKYEKKLHAISRKIFDRDYSVLNEINELLQEVEPEENKSVKVNLLGHKAVVYRLKGEFDRALNIIKEAIGLIQEYKFVKASIAAWISKIEASIYFVQGNYAMSVESYLNALDICENNNLKKDAANVMLDLSQCYMVRNEFEKSEYYCNKSLQYFLSVDPDYTNWIIYFHLGQVMNKNAKVKDALINFGIALEDAKKLNDLNGQATIYNAMAQTYFDDAKFKLALQNAEAAFEIAKKMKFTDVLENATMLKAKLLIEKGQVEEGVEMLNQLNLEKSQEYNIASVYEILYKAYELLGKYKESLAALKKYNQLNADMIGLEAKKHAEEMESKFQSKLKEREKEILRLQSIEMEQKALRVQLNPHFFFNSLNSINKFIVENDAENASLFLFKFSSLMRKTLENSEESFITIEEEVKFLNDYLSLEQLRFNDSFEFRIIIDEELEDDFVKIPTMMLQPYIENSIKHGVNGFENGRIEVRFQLVEDEAVLCIIEDNGAGVSESKSNHKSMGTSILENRIKILKEQYKLDFDVKRIDLKSDSDTSSGTRIELLIPNLDLI